MRVIAVTNQKGGVGKTTTAVSVAHRLAMLGHTVCLVDLDVQGNSSTCLGLRPAPGVYTLLRRRDSLDHLLVQARERLWLLPGDTMTERLKVELVIEDSSGRLTGGGGDGDIRTRLADELAGLTVEFTIIDTGPSRDILHQLALFASDDLIIPCALDHLSLVGVAQQMTSLEAMRKAGRALTVLAIVPQFWEAQTLETERNLRLLVERFGNLVTPSVPRQTAVREAAAQGRTIWQYLRPIPPEPRPNDHPKHLRSPGGPPANPVLLAYDYVIRRLLYGR